PSSQRTTKGLDRVWRLAMDRVIHPRKASADETLYPNLDRKCESRGAVSSPGRPSRLLSSSCTTSARKLAFESALAGLHAKTFTPLEGGCMMSNKERRKYHGTHRLYQRPRNWARLFREGSLEGEQRGLRRQQTAFRGTR